MAAASAPARSRPRRQRLNTPQQIASLLDEHGVVVIDDSNIELDRRLLTLLETTARAMARPRAPLGVGSRDSFEKGLLSPHPRRAFP